MYLTDNFYILKSIFLEERSVAFVIFPKMPTTHRVRVLIYLKRYYIHAVIILCLHEQEWCGRTFLMNLLLLIISTHLFSIQKTSKLTEKILKSSNHCNLLHEVSPKKPNFFLTVLLSWQKDMGTPWFKYVFWDMIKKKRGGLKEWLWKEKKIHTIKPEHLLTLNSNLLLIWLLFNSIQRSLHSVTNDWTICIYTHHQGERGNFWIYRLIFNSQRGLFKRSLM